MYHVFNRTNNKEPLFKSDDNRKFFLKRFGEILSPFLRTYAYTLQPNHFHFLISVRKEIEILEHLRKIPKEELLKKELTFLNAPSDEMMNTLISSCFQRFFTSYSMAFNKQQARQGNLFYKKFQRLQVRNQDHFSTLVYYLHANCRKHNVQVDFENYKWSSFQSFLCEKPTLLERKFVLDWFGGREMFLEFHQTETDEAEIMDLILE